ncbi:MAG: serine hydroxymethyltransferase [Oligoflexales bacterium]|nr:serine hydroxymethyltransferase [Oligoflexales bacterium]
MRPWNLLKNSDPEVFHLIERELKRQREGLELIASENFADLDLISSMGNPLNNKYAEGLPGKRYYGGCEEVDKLESLAIERACSLFGAKYANVQPHSGAQANSAVFLALLRPGDRILGLNLSHGGHLTHGSPVNSSGLLYEAHFYSVRPEDDLIDEEELLRKAKELKPKMIIAGASAYPRTIHFERFRKIADEVGAYLLVDMAHIAGLVAAGLHPNPVPHAHIVTSTTHKTLRGPRGGLILWNDEALSAALNKGVFPGTQGGPLEHIIAAKAVCLKKAAHADFIEYQKQVILNAKTLASELTNRATKFRLVSGGTDNHLLLLDLSRLPESKVSGKEFEEALGKAAITVNKNTVPGEKRSPFVTSGIRLGSPAVTSRGMGTPEMEQIAAFFHQVYAHIEDEKKLLAIKSDVQALAEKFPLYREWS